MTNTLKAFQDESTDDLYIVGNYIVLWGGSDLAGERFTPETNFKSIFTDLDMVAVDFEHGRQPDKAGPKSQPFGKVLWDTAKSDDVGLWVKRGLDRRNKYISKLIELGVFDANLMGTSSQAMNGGIKKSKDGTIDKWAIERDSLTWTPMEPRMMADNQVKVIESLASDIPQVKSVYPGLFKSLEDDITDAVQQANNKPDLSAESEVKSNEIEESRAKARIEILELEMELI